MINKSTEPFENSAIAHILKKQFQSPAPEMGKKLKIKIQLRDKSGDENTGSPLPPLQPGRYSSPQIAYVKKSMMSAQVRTFDDNCVLVNPLVDASDKELCARNNFKTAGKNLVSFVENGSQALFTNNVFRPTKLGMLTKDNIGVVKNMNYTKHNPGMHFKSNSVSQPELDATAKKSIIIKHNKSPQPTSALPQLKVNKTRNK